MVQVESKLAVESTVKVVAHSEVVAVREVDPIVL